MLLQRPVSGPVFTSLLQGSIRFQSWLAVAVSGALFGEKGLTFAALSVAVLVPLCQVYCVLALAFFGASDSGLAVTMILKRVAFNPLTLSCALGLVLNPVPVPDFLFETVSLLGAASIPLTLLAVGAGLNLILPDGHLRLVAASLAVRLIGMPALVLALCFGVGLSGLGRTVAVISGAVPAAATAYTLARMMGGDAALMASIITFQSLAAAFTLPLFIYIAERIGQ